MVDVSFRKRNVSKKRYLRMKKGQLKIQQMAFMLIAVTLLFVFVGLFVLSIKTSGIRGAANTLREENAALLVDKLANSPEFSCGNLYSSKSNCIDLDKVIALKNYEDYEDFWGVNEIVIETIYPVDERIECTNKNYPDCNVLEIYSNNPENKIYKSSLVSLCRVEQLEDKAYDKCEIGKLKVSYEEAQ